MHDMHDVTDARGASRTTLPQADRAARRTGEGFGRTVRRDGIPAERLTAAVRPRQRSAAAAYNALEPPPLPPLPAGGFRRRGVRAGAAPAGQLAISVRPPRTGDPAGGGAAARPVYETPLPSAAAPLPRLGGYLANMLEDGRIPRALKADLETALLSAGRPADADGRARALELLDRCAAHGEATPETRALVAALRTRLDEGRAGPPARDAPADAGPRTAGRAPASAPLGEFVAAAARARRANAHVTVAAGGDVAARTGAFARLRGERRTAANRAAADAFVAALRDRYGDEVAGLAAGSDGVRRALSLGRPLEARHVNAAVFHANTLAAQYRRAADRLVDTYVRTEPDTGVSLTRLKIDDAARRIAAGHGPRGVASLVDPDAVAARVAQALRARGGDGRRLVTTDDARGILDGVVRRELMAAYEAARADAMAKLSFDDPASMSRRALAAAADARGLALGPERLEPGAVDALARRTDAAVRALGAASLGSDAELQALAERVAGDFVDGRARARAAVPPGLDEAARVRIADQVAHDATPAELVPRIADAYADLAADVGRLGTRLSAAETGAVVAALHDRIVQAVADSGIDVDVDNQNAVYAQCWRVLLAPGGRAGHASVADRFEPGAPLRELAEGLGWIKRRFPLTREGARETAYNDRQEVEIAGKPISRVSEYLTLMENLANVVSAVAGRPGEIDDPEDLGALSAPTLGVLRDLDMPLPRELATP